MNNAQLVIELCKLSTETSWLEFKCNNYTPKMIGEDISALANSAALQDKAAAYMVWGINDTDHSIVGTDYDLQKIKKGNEELENWLRGLLSKNADFSGQEVFIQGKRIFLLIISRAMNQTVTFEKMDYVRVGSYTKKLSEYPAIQAQLWDRIRNAKFEDQAAKQDLTPETVIQLLDCSVYFEIQELPQPSDVLGLIHYMIEERVIFKQDNGMYSITNLGALLFARRIEDFPKLARKAIRVVQYQDNNRVSMLKENTIGKGYAVGFEDLLKYVEALIPTQELISGALRKKAAAYPLLAIREVVANALIHQDFSVGGTGPVIELFKNRIEITNSGIPLVDIQRIIDNPPISRNEHLATLMRRLRMCEELGTGWDKIVSSCEFCYLPAPQIILYEDSIRVILFSEKAFSALSMEEKLWATYLHACIKFVQGEQMTNSSLRGRFGLKETYSSSISRIINEAVKEGKIKPFDASTAPRYMKYIPWWA